MNYNFIAEQSPNTSLNSHYPPPPPKKKNILFYFVNIFGLFYNFRLTTFYGRSSKILRRSLKQNRAKLLNTEVDMDTSKASCVSKEY